MNRTVRWMGVGLVFVLCSCVAAAQAQQRPVSDDEASRQGGRLVTALPESPSRTAQAPGEQVPTLAVPRLIKFAGALAHPSGTASGTSVSGTTQEKTTASGAGKTAAQWVPQVTVTPNETSTNTLDSIASPADVTQALTFVGITPCRIIETRGFGFTGQAGPPSLVAGAQRTFQITGTVPGVPAQCGIPTTAQAISVNFTVTGFAGAGDIRAFPAGGTVPLTSIINYRLENVANATTVPLGPSGGGENGITVQADGSGTEFIADVNGYYVPRPFTTLESGQTLRGTWGAGGAATAAAIDMVQLFTFNPPLASAPTGNFIPQGGASTAACPGSVTNPTATPGNLCVYESTGTNRTFICTVKPSLVTSCGTDAWGAGVVVSSNAAGQYFSYGTWAVTAP